MAVILTRTGAIALGLSATTAFAAVLALDRDDPGEPAPRIVRAVVRPPVDLGVPGEAGIVVDADGLRYRGRRALSPAELRWELAELAGAARHDRMSSHWAVPLRVADGGSAAKALEAIRAAFDAGFDRVIVTTGDRALCHVDRAPTDDEIAKATSTSELCLTGRATLAL